MDVTTKAVIETLGRFKAALQGAFRDVDKKRANERKLLQLK